ncbi:MAG: hypothetical protein JWM03_1279 [Rhodocyclales bacterium]|nr:hypothetical protein [Rhodocyclales bacterium]MDB5888407.1 hypothetical protein [Rhodocyclales bacterium]
MQSPQRVSDLTRTLCVLLLIGSLLFACFWVLRPFVAGLLWGALIVVSSWSAMLRVQGWVGGRRGLATALMMIAFTLVVVVPVALSIVTLVDNGGELVDWVSSVRDGSLATPPDWLTNLPYIGPRAAIEWQRLLGSGSGSLGMRINEHGREITAWIFSHVGSLGSVLMHFAVAICVASLLFIHGERAARFVRRLALRLAGERADALVMMAGRSVSGVAMAIVGTAIVQSFIGGLSLFITGVPYAAVLTSLMLMLCLAQVGSAPILVPAVIWMFWQGHTWQAVVLIVFTLIGGTLDHILRPMLIKRGANMPFLLSLVGSIGGLLGFGLLGLFIGPVILAITHAVVTAWVDDHFALADVDQNSSDADR